MLSTERLNPQIEAPPGEASTMCAAFWFSRMYLLSHPKNYVSSLSIIYFPIKVSNKYFIYYEEIRTACLLFSIISADLRCLVSFTSFS